MATRRARRAPTNGASGSESTAPVQVVGLTSGYSLVKSNYIHACATPGPSGIVCWGWGSSGQLGDGQTFAPSGESKVPVQVVGY